MTPAAFITYAHADDYGDLTTFRESLNREVEMFTGGRFPIFQDRNGIEWEQNWKARIPGDAEVAPGSVLGGPRDWSQPPKQEKVAAAKTAAIGQKDPVKSFLDGVSNAYTSKIDRSAMRTARGEHSLL